MKQAQTHLFSRIITLVLLTIPFAGTASGSEEKAESFTVEAGPIWNNDHAQERCPEILLEWLRDNQGRTAMWKGHWWTTEEGRMSVCAFQRGADFTPSETKTPPSVETSGGTAQSAAPAENSGESLPEWEGEYCHAKGCIGITGLREGPAGFAFSFTCVSEGKQAREGSAPVDGHSAGYIDMLFTLDKSGRMLRISPDPDMKPSPDEPWTAACMGTYMRK